MSHYSKSLLALAIALAAVVFSAVWLGRRAMTLSGLMAEFDGIQQQVEVMRGNGLLVAEYEKRIDALQCELAPVKTRFVGRDYETPRLVMAVVRSAGLSGMEMMNALKLESGDKLSGLPGGAQIVEEVAHQVCLRGSYAGLVKFLQSMNDWDAAAKIVSMEIVHSSLDAGPTGDVKGAESKDEVDAMLHLSVFMLDDCEE